MCLGSLSPILHQDMQRRGKTASRITVILVFVLSAAAGVAAWHYWTIYTSISSARDDLLAVQRRLSDVGLNLKQGDLLLARRDLRSAERRLDDARSHLRWDPFVQLARVTPGTSRQVEATDIFLDMATVLVRIGREATDAAGAAVALRDNPPDGQPLTKSLVDLLGQTSPQVERMRLLTREAIALRLELGDRGLVGPLASARNRVDEELPKLANQVEQLSAASEVLPGILGFRGERRYLVFALNNGEMLPGGGLVTAAGVLTVRDGVNGPIEFTDSVTWKDSAEALGVPYIPPPGPLQRYLLRDYTWNLLVSNWDPDFPTWAQQAREFYELVHGNQQVDGIIAVDLFVLERLLLVTGPQTLEIEDVGPVTFEPNIAVLQLEQLTRHAFEPTDDRKSVIGDLAERLLATLLTLPSSKWADAVSIVRNLGHERHIQVLSYDPEEQTLLRDFGWDGRLAPTDSDFVQFNEASVLSTKLNLIIQPEGAYRVDLDALGNVNHELRLRYHNPLPEWERDKDRDLVEKLMLGGLYGGYLRIMGPRGISGFDVEVDGQPGSVEDFGEATRSSWFGTFLALPAGARREVALRWRSTARADSETGLYRLLIQKQPGTRGLCVDLDIRRAGKEPRALFVSGGTRDDQGRVCLTSDIRVVARF